MSIKDQTEDKLISLYRHNERFRCLFWALSELSHDDRGTVLEIVNHLLTKRRRESSRAKVVEFPRA